MNTPTFEQGRLRVARELVGLSQSQLATQVGLSPAAISQFESGAARPSPETVATLSEALNVPVGFFAHPLTETHAGFFRSLRRTAVSDRRQARAVAHIAHDLALAAASTGRFPTSDVPRIPLDGLEATSAEIEDIAHQVRLQWQVRQGPIADIVQLLEKHGVVVIRLPLNSTDVDAFSLPFADHPVVVLGTDKNDRARSRFDCAHELAHLVMHGEQIWGIKEVRNPSAPLRRSVPDARGRNTERTADHRRLAKTFRVETALAGLAGCPAHARTHSGTHERKHLPDRRQGSIGAGLAPSRTRTAGPTGRTHAPVELPRRHRQPASPHVPARDSCQQHRGRDPCRLTEGSCLLATARKVGGRLKSGSLAPRWVVEQ